MRTIKWQNGKVMTFDQTKLPFETNVIEIKTCNEMAEAIMKMRVRGAPLLGASAAFALALTAHNSKSKNRKSFLNELEDSGNSIKKTRPTAVNLSWAIDRILKKARSFSGKFDDLKTLIIEEAQKIADEDAKANHSIGKNGAELLNNGDVVLTHCNAGELATVEYGTALGVVRGAWERGKKIKVIATETRPRLQGARLTAYELNRDGIPVILITDNMAGHLMQIGLIKKVVVGADRIVKDAVFNKIGTFTLAVLAKEHKIPFYVAAPKSTFDLSKRSEQVIIEERNPNEVRKIGSCQIVSNEIEVINPAFDATPLKYITAIIHEDGIYFNKDFARFTDSSNKRISGC